MVVSSRHANRAVDLADFQGMMGKKKSRMLSKTFCCVARKIYPKEKRAQEAINDMHKQFLYQIFALIIHSKAGNLSTVQQ